MIRVLLLRAALGADLSSDLSSDLAAEIRTVPTEERVVYLQSIVASAWDKAQLEEVAVAADGGASAGAVAAAGAAERRRMDRATLASMSGGNCAEFISCGECIAHGCGWCIGERDCVDDVPWRCQGDVDHVGTIGKFKTCPVAAPRAAATEPDLASAPRAPLGAAALDPASAQRREALRQAEIERIRSEIGGREAEAIATDAAAADDAAQREKHREVLRRAAVAASTPGSNEPYGATHPYETLGVHDGATNRYIKRAYRALSLLLHPDRFVRAPEAVRDAAQSAFADLVAAHDVLSVPEKRAAFDDYGGSANNFNTEWEYATFGDGAAQDFYRGSPHITRLTEQRWRRYSEAEDALRRETIWLVEFYAPWCGACQRFTGTFKSVAQQLVEDVAEPTIEVGVVNCASEEALKVEFNIRSYPTLRLVNVANGLQQGYDMGAQSSAEHIVAWARTIAREWTWLWAHSDVRRLGSRAEFDATVTNSTLFWAVIFLDGETCAPCKTAKTNALRLSASLLRSAPDSAGVATLDCASTAELRAWCSETIGVPAAPHAPHVRGFASGSAAAKSATGEALYNANEVRPHVALRIIERVVRLVAAEKLEAKAALVAAGEEAVFGFAADAPPPPAYAPNDMNWGAPTGRAALAAAAASDGRRTTATAMLGG